MYNIIYTVMIIMYYCILIYIVRRVSLMLTDRLSEAP